MDVKCAFFHGHTRRNVYVDLSTPDERHGDKNVVGKLLKAMCGTRAGDRDFVGDAESHDPNIRTLPCFQEALCRGQCRRLLIRGT